MVKPLSRSELKRLQAMINRTAMASASFYRQQEALNEWCRERYGFEPGDVDADSIIDSVLGGCGEATGMTAEDFDAEMRRSAP